MELAAIFFGIFLFSLLWAVFSMRDFRVPPSLERVIPHTKQGRIVLFRGGSRHYEDTHKPQS